MRINLSNQHTILDDQSVVQRVNALLIDAIEKCASDIHLEQTQDHLRVRFRVDGMLIDQKPFAAHLSSSIIARLKILAQLNIAERRIPQDGKFQINHNKQHATSQAFVERIFTFSLWPATFPPLVMLTRERTWNSRYVLLYSICREKSICV